LVNLFGAAADTVKTVTGKTLDTSGGGADWLRVCDVAGLLGVSPNTVRRWSDDGVLTSYRSAGGHRRYVRDDILATIAARQTGGLAAPGNEHLEPAGGDLVAALRRQVATLIEKLADRDRDLARQNKLMSELVELGAMVPGASDVGAAFNSLGSRLIETIDADTCELYSLQGDRIELLAGFDRDGVVDPWIGWTGDIRDFPSSAATLARHEVLIVATADDQAGQSRNTNQHSCPCKLHN
jgi:excisionase family DNA binding protein